MTAAQGTDAPIKMLVVAHSGMGKTGAPASLAAAGYRIRVLDLEAKIDVLRNYVTDPSSPYVKQNPNVGANIAWETLTEKKKNMGGRIVSVKASVWPAMLKLLDRWAVVDPEHPENSYDLGRPADWGPDCVLVVDTLSAVSSAALDYHLSLNGALAATRSQNEGRRDIGSAQNIIRDFLELLADQSFNTNVIINSHITQATQDGYSPIDPETGKPREEAALGFPSAIGRALSPQIPRYFGTVLQIVARGNRHVILTRTNGEVATKSSAPLKVAKEYPLETGLADYFYAVRGRNPIPAA